LASDVMTPDPVCVQPGCGLRRFALMLEEHGISGAPVVDARGVLVGVASRTDLIRRCSEGSADVPPAFLFEVLRAGGGGEAETVIPEPLVCVEDIMTTTPVTVTAGTPVGRVARLMFERHIHRVVVVNEEQCPIGVITSLDVLGVWPGA